MAWFKGTTTDWQDMMDIIAEVGGDEHISAFAIYDGGSGYVIGDTISLVGGTFNLAAELEVRAIQTGDTVATVASIVAGGAGYAVGDLVEIVGGSNTVVAVLEVTTEAGGVVTGLQINDPGVYSVQPAGTVATAKTTGSGDDNLTVTLTWNSAVTGIATTVYVTNAGSATVTPTDPITTGTSGSGVGLLLNLTWAETAWETLMDVTPMEALSAVIAAGGTGYSVGDKLILDSGAGVVLENAIFQVATLSGSAVATVTLFTEGYYHTVTPNPGATTPDPSTPGGSGCTLTVTYQGYADGTYTDVKHLVLHNTVTDVYVGIEALNQTAKDADVWRIAAFTGFTSSSVKFSEQPGYCGQECFVPMHDASFNWNMSMTDRRIACVFNIASGSNYTNMFLGLMNPYQTAVEYPYPAVNLGCISQAEKYTYSGNYLGGMHNPGANLVGAEGPGQIRNADGTLEIVRNWYINASLITTDTANIGMYPIAHYAQVPELVEERWYTASTDDAWFNVVRIQDTDATTLEKIARLNDLYTLIPIIFLHGVEYKMLGRLSGVYWFDNADGALASNDRIWVNGVAYRVYQNCRKNNKNNMFCIEEG